MWKALSEPYANTEYLLGIQLPEDAARADMHCGDAGLLRGLEEWLSQPGTSFIAALEATPRPACTSRIYASRSQISASSYSLEYFTPPQSPIIDDGNDNDTCSSEEPTPDPSPLFTPADRGSECDPFDVALEQDVLDLDVVCEALQLADKAGHVLRNDRIISCCRCM